MMGDKIFIMRSFLRNVDFVIQSILSCKRSSFSCDAVVMPTHARSCRRSDHQCYEEVDVLCVLPWAQNIGAFGTLSVNLLVLFVLRVLPAVSSAWICIVDQSDQDLFPPTHPMPEWDCVNRPPLK
jgi:hypothetical protein